MSDLMEKLGINPDGGTIEEGISIRLNEMVQLNGITQHHVSYLLDNYKKAHGIFIPDNKADSQKIRIEVGNALLIKGSKNSGEDNTYKATIDGVKGKLIEILPEYFESEHKVLAHFTSAHTNTEGARIQKLHFIDNSECKLFHCTFTSDYKDNKNYFYGLGRSNLTIVSSVKERSSYKAYLVGRDSNGDSVKITGTVQINKATPYRIPNK